MSRADRDRWNRKYRELRPPPSAAPDPLLIAHAGLLTGRGLALDVACGRGHNSLHLARLGYRVIGVDGSIEGLRRARAATRAAGLTMQFAAVDLDHQRFPPECFDLVVVFRFLDRTLLPNLAQSLRPGGLMIYQTYNRNRLRDHPDFHPAYLLQPGELAGFFSGFETIASNDTPAIEDPLSYWIGRRPA